MTSYHHGTTSLYNDHKLDENDLIGSDSMNGSCRLVLQGKINNE